MTISPKHTRVLAGVSAFTFDRLAFALVAAVILSAAALSPIQSDTWWHLRAGAEVVRSHQIDLFDRYSHTAYGLPWPNHEWLSQVLLYAAYRLGGLPLLGLSTAVVVTAAWALIWRLCEGTTMRRVVVVAPLLVPASLHWSPRPHALSLLFLSVAITVIVTQRLRWLPLLFFVWANCHGGVVLGLAVVGTALAAAILDEPNQWRRYAASLVACAAAATLTPLGFSFWREIPASLARIRQYPIDEWRTPSMADPVLAPFWLAAGAICLCAALEWRALLQPRNRRTRILCASALVVLPFAVSAIRNVGPFVMLAAPGLCGLLTCARRGQSGVTQATARADRPAFNLAVVTVTAVLVVVTIASAYGRQNPHLGWTPLPLASLRVLDQCPGNLYNRYDEGGYLIWFAPEHRVFLDGRQDPYPVPLVHAQLQIEQSGDYASTFATYQIHCAFLPTSSPVSQRLESAGWTPLYKDAQWIVLADRLNVPARVSMTVLDASRVARSFARP